MKADNDSRQMIPCKFGRKGMGDIVYGGKWSRKTVEVAKCEEKFRFGTREKCVGKEVMEIPIKVESMLGKIEALEVKAYVVEEKVPYLLGKKTLSRLFT